MSASVQDFHSQIASIMEVLANAAVAEICKVVDDGYAVVNLEMSRNQKENEFLRRRVKVLELQISRYRAERLKSPAETSFCSRYPGVRLLQHRQGRETPTGSCLQYRNRFLNRTPQTTSPIILDQDPDQEVVTTTKAEPLESEEDSDLVIVKVEGNASINNTTPNLSATIQAPHKEGFVKNPSSIQDTEELGLEDGGNLKASPPKKDQLPIPCSTQTAQASLTFDQVSGNCTTSTSHRRNSQDGSTSKYSHSQTSQFTPAILSIESGMACSVSQSNATSQYKAMLPVQNYQVCSKVGSSVVEQPMEQTWVEGYQVMGNNNFSNCPELTNQVSKNQETILPFACTRQFAHPSQLKKLKMVPSGEKPYTCIQCGKKFGQVSSLKRHRLVHTGERPYPCPHCGKEFTTAGNLKVHQSVHTGEKKFNCSTCGKNFSFLSNLIRHQMIHAKNTTM